MLVCIHNAFSEVVSQDTNNNELLLDIASKTD